MVDPVMRKHQSVGVSIKQNFCTAYTVYTTATAYSTMYTTATK